MKVHYEYEITGEGFISVDAIHGDDCHGALFFFDSNGALNLDTDSDGCEANPHDKYGSYPDPPAEMIEKARGIWRAIQDEEGEEEEGA